MLGSLSLSLAQYTDCRFNFTAEKIQKWLDAPLPTSNHNIAMKKRQPSTGEWFTQSKEFTDWKMGTSCFVWLHGIRES